MVGRLDKHPLKAAAVAAVVLLAALGWAADAGAVDASGTIRTAAGNGTRAYSGDAGAATSASLNRPQGIVAAPGGGYFIADNFNHVVRKVDTDGTIRTVAGTGTAGYSGDGGPATSAKLNYPRGLAVRVDGSLLIADTNNSRIRQVAPDGTITTVVGTGTVGGAGDGGPATSAQVCFASDVDVTSDGGLLIADPCNNRIRRVSPAGTITTVAGTGVAGSGADNVPATDSQLRQPHGVATMPDGSFVIADTDNHRVRRVYGDGYIFTIAGTGTAGGAGDGRFATGAQIASPQGIAVTSDGSVLIPDTDNHRVRRITPLQQMQTIAGTGSARFAGDGGSALAAGLSSPWAVAELPGGDVLIADTGNNRIRRVQASVPGGTTFVVNTTADTTDHDCARSPGNCTLREAIEAANAAAQPSRIEFAIGSGPQTITLGSPLPGIVKPVTIDGNTQPGFTDKPLIELTTTTGVPAGLEVRANSTIRGLVVNGFGARGIWLAGGSSVVEGCYIGTTGTGLAPKANADNGILVESPGNTIGGTTAGQRNVISGNGLSGVLIQGTGAGGNRIVGNYIGVDAIGTGRLANRGAGITLLTNANAIGGAALGEGNVISGNAADGLQFLGSDANTVAGNMVGTDASGKTAIPNGFSGIWLVGDANDNVIGGTASAERNVISGNGRADLAGDGFGLLVQSSHGTRVLGNYVGISADGSKALGNEGDGVRFADSGNSVGDVTAGAGNVIGGNGDAGVRLNSDGGSVRGNRIGTDPTGATAIPNATAGVAVSGKDNVIGSAQTAGGNVISGNRNEGVWISGSGATNNTVRGNRIGTTPAGTAAVGNGTGVAIGSTGNTITGNLISGNSSDGVRIGGADADGNTVADNLIGTDPSGNAAVGNGLSGVVVTGAAGDNVIGGTTAAARNVISGNGRPETSPDGLGVVIDTPGDDLAHGNKVLGNYIGIRANGSQPLANEGDGVLLGDSGNSVGGSATGAGNVVSGNGQSGIYLPAGSNTVLGNLVGTDATGAFAVANNTFGVAAFSDNNTIGDGSAGGRNLLSGNLTGVAVFGAGNTVRGNRVGTDISGERIVENRSYGVWLAGGTSNVVGGAAAGQGNLVSGNPDAGIFILGGSQNSVLGNYVGSDDDGNQGLGNAHGIRVKDTQDATIGGAGPGAGNLIVDNDRGILVDGTSRQTTITGNSIGVGTGGTPLGNKSQGVVFDGGSAPAATHSVGGTAPGAANTIAFNGGPGVSVLAAAWTVSIRRNSIHSNGGLGIGLGGNGPIANDHLDGDTGPNGLQNSPRLQVATAAGGQLSIRGVLDSTPGQTYTIDLFSSTACDASGSGEGRDYLASVSVTTDASGAAAFTHAVTSAVAPGDVVTATATDSAGNSSEFSPCQTVAALPALSAGDVTVGESAGKTIVPVTLSGAGAGTVTVAYATAPRAATAGADYESSSGTLTFAPGETTKNVTVPIADDAVDEPDEDLELRLTNPQGATLAPGHGVVTITDDDSPPALTIADAGVTEGTGGASAATFAVTLSAPSAKAVTVEAITSDGSAQELGDYGARRTTLTFGPGETSKAVTVPVTTDALDEPDETFSVALANESNATVARRAAVGTIADDDLPAQQPPPQQPQQPQQPQDSRDTVAPALGIDGLAGKLTRAALLSRGLKFGVTPNEAVSLDVQLIGGPKVLTPARSGDVVIARTKLPLATGKRSAKLAVLTKLRKLLTRRGADLRLVVLATDAAGNQTRVTRKIVLR